MGTHHTKTQGDLGVLKAQVALVEQGYLVLLPQTEHYPFDLVAYKTGVFKRIQVKYRSLKAGKLEVKFQSIWSDKKQIHRVPTNKEEIDLYCVYCPNNDTCYWFDPKQFEHSCSLRVENTKNNQTKGINKANEYITIPS